MGNKIGRGIAFLLAFAFLLLVFVSLGNLITEQRTNLWCGLLTAVLCSIPFLALAFSARGILGKIFFSLVAIIFVFLAFVFLIVGLGHEDAIEASLINRYGYDYEMYLSDFEWAVYEIMYLFELEARAMLMITVTSIGYLLACVLAMIFPNSDSDYYDMSPGTKTYVRTDPTVSRRRESEAREIRRRLGR